MIDIILGVIREGLLFSIMALGVYITYKILDFPDLSVDGTFPLGAAVTAALIVKGVNPYLTLLIALAIGALAGLTTGIIHVVFKVRDLLSGIIVMTALYSINLRIAGSANVSIFSKDSIFENSIVDKIFPDALKDYVVIIVLFVIVALVKICMDLYLKTKSGLLLRAVGDNEILVTSLAKNKGITKIIGLSIANALAALAGSIYCQMNGFFEISSGTGTMVIGLASVIIGTKLLKNVGFIKATTAVIFGSFVYKACISIAIDMGMNASDLKLITSILFLAILILSNFSTAKVKKYIQQRREN